MSSSENLQADADRFAGPARRYCAFVETMQNMTEEDRVRKVIRLLSDLVGAATELPTVTPTDEDPVTVRAPAFTFAAVDLYYEVFDPFIRDKLVVGSLSDDLGDVYVDLHDGLNLLDRGYPADALWHWRFHYEIHWGDHAVDALRALHRLFTGRGEHIS